MPRPMPMIEDQALVASKHYLIEIKDKNLADKAVDTPVAPSMVPRKADAKLQSLLDQTDDGPSDGNDYGRDYWMGKK